MFVRHEVDVDPWRDPLSDDEKLAVWIGKRDIEDMQLAAKLIHRGGEW